jgi:predicted DCC family thiol-disulfide oxidoreductase YuxK
MPESVGKNPQFANLNIMNNAAIKQSNIILFDGICNLCNGSVIFILQNEKKPIFQFASIQSEAGKELLELYRLPKDYNQALVLIENGKMYLGSTAALKIGQKLKFPWSFLAHAGFIVPKYIRDRVYNQIAVHRYQWFGKRDVCMIPTEDLKARFL